jgi:hypothetical protein
MDTTQQIPRDGVQVARAEHFTTASKSKAHNNQGGDQRSH